MEPLTLEKRESLVEAAASVDLKSTVCLEEMAAWVAFALAGPMARMASAEAVCRVVLYLVWVARAAHKTENVSAGMMVWQG